MKRETLYSFLCVLDKKNETFGNVSQGAYNQHSGVNDHDCTKCFLFVEKIDRY